MSGNEVQGMYNLFSENPCGKFYQQWEQCVEGLRKTSDFDSLETKCPLENPADLFAKCMQQHPQQYSHLVTPGTKHELVVEGLTNIFAVMYGHCRSNGKCNEGEFLQTDNAK
eukprot:7208985-Pyramimonas_sp.AAC.2